MRQVALIVLVWAGIIAAHWWTVERAVDRALRLSSEASHRAAGAVVRAEAAHARLDAAEPLHDALHVGAPVRCDWRMVPAGAAAELADAVAFNCSRAAPCRVTWENPLALESP